MTTTSVGAQTKRRAAITDGVSEVESSIWRALETGANTVVVPFPPVAEPLLLWDSESDGVCLELRDGTQFIGLGEARIVSALVDVPRLFDRLSEVRLPETDTAGPPVAIGGMAFEDKAPVGRWQAFGQARFVLPRWLLTVRDRRTYLRFTGTTDGGRQAFQRELQALWARLTGTSTLLSTPFLRSVDALPAHWHDYIRSITESIAAKEVDKVVAATSVALSFDSPVDPRGVLRTLRSRFSGCTLYALRRSGTTFLGATPERLLQVSGRRVVTEAVAGSAPPADAEQLLLRDKDILEHAFVVDEMCASLSRFGSVILGERTVRVLPNIAHLVTPISVELDSDLGAVELAATLHPTPAVGGMPRQSSFEYISAHEAPLHPEGTRGWYSGPFGYVDGKGNGEWVVALRGGLLQGQHGVAYAGCGIVAGSKSEHEAREATMKLGAFLSAFETHASETE